MEKTRKPQAWLILFSALIVISGLFYWSVDQRRRARKELAKKAELRPQPPQPPLPGELILKNYGNPATRPEEDLTMLANALSNLTLLIKGTDPFRLGANEEFAAALRGKNHTHLRFLPDVHKVFNAQGQLVDRWMTPLFFHALSHDRIDIRSAGPDHKMWTDDDIHRHYNGQFLQGSDLNAASLSDEDQRKASGP